MHGAHRAVSVPVREDFIHCAHFTFVFRKGEAFATTGMWRRVEFSHIQLPAGALEVKTTAAKQPQSVRITSERQLDDTGVGALFLHVVAVDEREVAPTGTSPGTSLPGIIGELRIKCAIRW